MKPLSLVRRTTAVALIAVLTGCASHKGSLQPVPPITDPVVFFDTFGAGMDFQAFSGSLFTALAIDNSFTHSGSASLRFTIPDGASGKYAGGAFVTSRARDLSGYNALTFWARADRPLSINIAGLGNDNTGTSRYTASRGGINIVADQWTKVIIPIPLPSRLTREKGLFFFSEAHECGVGATLWFDDVQFEIVPDLILLGASFPSQTVTLDLGTAVSVTGANALFRIDGLAQPVSMSDRYLDFVSSDSTIAKVVDGTMLVVGVGSAQLTARLGDVSVNGQINLTSKPAPLTGAPPPTLPAGDVIALFSNSYPQVPVDTWSAVWDVADLSDVKLQGNDTKKYSNLSFAGVEFTTTPINATAMTHFHVDVWAAEGTVVRVKLVDFGADGAFAGGDDSEQELFFTAATNPVFTTGAWSSLDIPLSAFTGLTSRGHLAQLIFSSANVPTLYVDNVYLHR